MAYALTLGAVSFLIAVIWGMPADQLPALKGIGKQIRIDQPGSHQVKTGTPTMGGILFVVPVLLITGVLNIVNLAGHGRHRPEHAASVLLPGVARRPGRRSTTGRASRASAAGRGHERRA